MKKHYANRIKYLSKEYSETHASREECFITNSPIKKRLNKNYKDKQLKQLVDDVLIDVSQRKIIREEVMFIVLHNNLSKLCGNCSREKIISVIILFVLRGYNPKLKEEEHKLWKKYDLNWKIYARIIANILRNIRSKGVIK